jgi:LysM repeat protein
MSQHPQPRPGQEYTVQSGDTLWGIAQRAYNDPEDWDTIYDANKGIIGNNPNLIYPGQRLQIPSQSDPNKKKPIPTPAPTTHAPPPTTPTPLPPTTPTPTPPPPPTTQAPKQGEGEDDDSPLDWIEHELGEKKED